MGVRALFLVGFMASGKSSVGLELARRLSWSFVDLDAQIEGREKKTVSQIFAESGEPAFREAETAALKDLVENLSSDSVVALGGGAFVQESNRDLLREWRTVFLEAPIDELWQRSQQDKANRPLGKNREQFANLYHQRLPQYRKATFTVRTSGKDLLSICAEIESTLQIPAKVTDSSGTDPMTGELL